MAGPLTRTRLPQLQASTGPSETGASPRNGRNPLPRGPNQAGQVEG